MAVKKLNADARPFHGSNRLRLSPLSPTSMTGLTAGPLPLPLVPNYSCGPFAIPAPLQPEYHYPLPPPPPYLCNGVPLLPPATAAYLRKHDAPLLPHGRSAHMLTFPRGAVIVEKLKAQAAAKAKARAAVTVKVPPAAAAPRSRRPVALPCGPRAQQQAGVRGRSKEHRRRQAARSPSPVFTTRPPSPLPAPAWLGRRSTVMIRNIPNKLTRAMMMELLDDHCARANKRRGRGRAVLSAYDFLYVPMDFSAKPSSNMGYAFVNLTTAEAARGLHYALHGSHWKMFNSKKVIDIRAARIQGKEALVRHFSGSTFACHTDEFLPAVFSPPRDGAAFPAEPRRVGHRAWSTSAVRSIGSGRLLHQV